MSGLAARVRGETSMTGGFDSFRLPNCTVGFETTQMARYLFPTQTISPLFQAGVRATCAWFNPRRCLSNGGGPGRGQDFEWVIFVNGRRWMRGVDACGPMEIPSR